MSQFFVPSAVRPIERDRAEQAANDFLWKVYRWMTVGLALTGLSAALTVRSEAAMQLIFGNPLVFWGLVIGELVMVFSFSRKAARVSAQTAMLMFLGYSILNGLTLSAVLLAYTATSVAHVFFVTGGSFAALSFYGATTKKNLSGLGQALFIGLVGILIAGVVNMFVASSPLSMLISVAGVGVFGGLVAYDNQRLKNMFYQAGDTSNLALIGALSLYLNFINLFLSLLRLLGNRR